MRPLIQLQVQVVCFSVGRKFGRETRTLRSAPLRGKILVVGIAATIYAILIQPDLQFLQATHNIATKRYPPHSPYLESRQTKICRTPAHIDIQICQQGELNACPALQDRTPNSLPDAKLLLVRYRGSSWDIWLYHSECMIWLNQILHHLHAAQQLRWHWSSWH